MCDWLRRKFCCCPAYYYIKLANAGGDGLWQACTLRCGVLLGVLGLLHVHMCLVQEGDAGRSHVVESGAKPGCAEARDFLVKLLWGVLHMYLLPGVMSSSVEACWMVTAAPNASTSGLTGCAVTQAMARTNPAQHAWRMHAGTVCC